MNVSIETSWREVLQAEFDKPYFANIRASLISARNAGKIIYPPGPQIFNAFNSTPFDKVKVVIIG
ncbi:MAG TPA: uracil-DNA glycosylase, partial [Saprospiraceae bacterium]|nr:uracil-DNA glycosylase [Saprospiraceae bacterium]